MNIIQIYPIFLRFLSFSKVFFFVKIFKSHLINFFIFFYLFTPFLFIYLFFLIFGVF